MRLSVGTVGVLTALLGCGGEASRTIHLSRVDLPGTPCDPPEEARQLYVEALGDFPVDRRSSLPGEAIRIADFPSETRELAVQVTGAVLGVGTDDRVGRSGTIMLDELADDDTIRLLLAPPRAFCRTMPLAAPRVDPVVVRAGHGVLVTGGGAAGAEWYDPDSASFVQVGAPHGDLAFARGARLPDGRALIVYEGGWEIYDPVTRVFGAEQANLRLHRAAQVALRTDGTVVVTGGCNSTGATPPCVASNDTQTFDAAGERWAAAFAPLRPRAGGVAVPVEGGRFWLVGGSSGVDPTPVLPELWDPEGASSGDGLFAGETAAPLPAGGLLAGYDGADVTVVAPLGGAATVRPTEAARAGATLTALDDGAVLIVGGGPRGAAGAVLYRPQLGGGPDPLDFPDGEELRGHGTAVLDDGAVLVVGGRGGDLAPRAEAFVYRDTDLGPWGYVSAETFADPSGSALVPGDPTGVSVEAATLVLRPTISASPLSSWALVSGPRWVDLELEADLTTASGSGAALVLSFRDPLSYWLIMLTPGAPASLVEVADGTLRAATCTGERDLDPLDHARVTLHAGSERLTVTAADREVLSCPLPALPRGLAGVGLPSTAGELRVQALDVRRATP